MQSHRFSTAKSGQEQHSDTWAPAAAGAATGAAASLSASGLRPTRRSSLSYCSAHGHGAPSWFWRQRQAYGLGCNSAAMPLVALPGRAERKERNRREGSNCYNATLHAYAQCKPHLVGWHRGHVQHIDLGGPRLVVRLAEVGAPAELRLEVPLPSAGMPGGSRIRPGGGCRSRVSGQKVRSSRQCSTEAWVAVGA